MRFWKWLLCNTQNCLLCELTQNVADKRHRSSFNQTGDQTMVSSSNILQWIYGPPPPSHTHTHTQSWAQYSYLHLQHTTQQTTCNCTTWFNMGLSAYYFFLFWEFAYWLRWNQALPQNKINGESLSLSWTTRKYHQCRKFTLAKWKTLGLCAVVFPVGTKYIIISWTAYLQSLVSTQQLL
jgi:hypothetical protein